MHGRPTVLPTRNVERDEINSEPYDFETSISQISKHSNLTR